MTSALPRQSPDRNDVGDDVSEKVPEGSPSFGVHSLRRVDRQIWELAAPYCATRSNDVHSLYAYGIARALLDELPEADPDLVLPAVLLHDTGWSSVPLHEILDALRPGARSTSSSMDVQRRHEIEGGRIARKVLEAVGFAQDRIDTIAEMVDGHDTRAEPLSLEDAILKDADKLWRVTPHGVDTVMDWFGLTRDQAHRLNAVRTHGKLFTAPARTMARVLSAVGWVDSSPQRVALG